MFWKSWDRRSKLTLSLACALVLLSTLAIYVRGQTIELNWFLHGLLLSLLFLYLSYLLVRYGKKLWRELLLAGFTFLIAIAISELLLRFLMPWLLLPHLTVLSSKELHHTLPAYTKMSDGTHNDEPYFFATNEDGLRSSYSRKEFRSKRARIALLGDSFVMGVGLSAEATLAHHLEKHLQTIRGKDDIAVLNCGVISYSPLLSKLQYDKIVRHYNPHIVFFLLDASDIGNDRRYAQDWCNEAKHFDTSQCNFDKEVKIPRSAFWKLASPLAKPLLFRPANEFLFALGLPNWRNNEAAKDKDFSTFFIYKEPLSKTKNYMQASLENVIALQEKVKNDGAHFIFVLSPRYHHWSSTDCPKNWESVEYGSDEPYEFSYLDYFSKNFPKDIPMLNLLPKFQSYQGPPLVFANDPHWNERGTKFVAALLAKELISRRLIPQR